MLYPKEFIEGLEKTLPPFFLRKDAETATCGLVKPSYLAFLASKGGGPKYVTSGKKAIYMKQDFIEWLTNRRTHHDRDHDYEPAKFGFRIARPEGASFGFEPAAEGAEG